MTSFWVSRSANEQADALEVLDGAQILEQVRLAAHDEVAGFGRPRAGRERRPRRAAP